MRARIKEFYSEEQINKIKDVELHRIAYMYYIERICELEIAFELDLSEKTIQRRMKEIREYLN